MPRRGDVATASPDESLASLPDVGAKTIAWLRAIGIESVSELRRVGPADAYARIAYRFGSAVNRNLLYALAMSLEGRKYNDATDEEKRRLCADAGIEFPGRRKRRR